MTDILGAALRFILQDEIVHLALAIGIVYVASHVSEERNV